VYLHAQTTPFATERSLEERVRDLERQLQSPKSAELPKPAELPKSDETAKPKVLAGWDNGFILRSSDDLFQLRITGQVQADYRYYLDQEDTTDLPTFLVRRARLGIEATVLKYYELRFLPDFGNGQTRIQDAYLNVRYWDEVQFMTGKFKQPFSIEQLIQDRFVPVIERSLIDQLVPARDVGLMIHGQKLLDDRLDYGVSVYGGVRDGDMDTDRNKEFAGRVAVRPLKGFGLETLDGLQLGIAGTIGDDEGLLVQNTLRTPANVPWFRFADGVRPDGQRARYSPEFVYVYGPAMLMSQYYWQSSSMLAPATATQRPLNVELTAEGFYVMGTLLITGEQRTSFSQTIDPIRPLDPVDGVFGCGAIELVGRVSQLELGTDDPRGFARLVNAARTARRATETTLGFNWYLNRYVRFQFNWEYARFSNAVRLGDSPNAKLDHQNSFITRFQIVF
jgi:phosphate-selective porin OprO/OprP